MDNQTTAPEVQSEQPTEVAQQPEATPEVQTPTETSFQDLIPEDYREEKSLQNFNTMDDFVKSYLSAQRLIGANKIAIPNKLSTEEDWQEVFKKLGAPEKPEDYKYNFTDQQFNEDQLKSFNQTAHKLGLLPKQAESLIKFYNEMNETSENAKTQVAKNKQMETEVLLQKEFGVNYGKRIEQAKKLASEVFPAEILNETVLKDGSRLGDNPDVIKAFSMLADKLSEDEIIKGDGVGYMTASEIEKEISELTEEGSPYWNKTHPNHTKAVEQVLKLREQLNG